MQAARAAGVGVGELESMRQRELRELAVSLGVASRGRRVTGKTLRASCERALANQTVLTKLFVPRAPPQAGIGPEGGGEVGSAEPVSDSPPKVAHNPTSKCRGARPMWMRKGPYGATEAEGQGIRQGSWQRSPQVS